MERYLSTELATALKQNSLWKNKLRNDKDSFLTIRQNRVDIYHKGGLLFSFDRSGFKTHIKYASVIPSNKQAYLTEDALKNYKLASDFESAYDRIKENCSLYSGIEASGISSLYHKHSYVSDSNVVVLDIEVSLQSSGEKNKHDRVDVVLYNKLERKLKFVEVKHYSNKEIWAIKGDPKVLSQIQRYENQVSSKKEGIINAYKSYIQSVNELTGAQLPLPLTLEDKVTLLIFGFDIDQKDGRLKTNIINNTKYESVTTYAKGDISSINMDALWQAS